MKYLFLLFSFCGFATVQPVSAQVPGKQDLYVHGVLYDKKGNSVSDSVLTVALFFNGQKLAETRPDAEGKYELTAAAYGNIRQVDINVYHQGELFYEQKDVVLKNGSGEINLPIPKEDDWYIFSLEGPNWDRGNFKYYLWSRHSTYRTPYGTFAYYKPYSFDPVIYHNKITQHITVRDKKGRPIANARVEIKVPDDAEPRWGFTDENGKLQLHMQFSRGARQGTFRIQAEGFRDKKIPFQSMDTFDQRTYRLKQKS